MFFLTEEEEAGEKNCLRSNGVKNKEIMSGEEVTDGSTNLGANIQPNTLGQCKQKCQENAECNALTWYQGSSECKFYQSFTAIVDRSGSDNIKTVNCLAGMHAII